MRLTEEALRSPELREKCLPGTGQIYRFVPLYETSSNGYIGRNETSLWKRVVGHKTPKSECPALRNAISRHGLHQFDLVVLASNIPVKELASAEKYWVAKFDTYKNGYNCTPGGESPPLCSPEVAAKVKATKNTEESRAKTVAASRRHWNDPVAHTSHASALRSSLEKSKAAREETLKRKADTRRAAKLAAMTTEEAEKYTKKLKRGRERQRKLMTDLMRLRCIPGYKLATRKDLWAAIRAGVLCT